MHLSTFLEYNVRCTADNIIVAIIPIYFGGSDLLGITLLQRLLKKTTVSGMTYIRTEITRCNSYTNLASIYDSNINL